LLCRGLLMVPMHSAGMAAGDGGNTDLG
jgi:hypothetical protein